QLAKIVASFLPGHLAEVLVISIVRRKHEVAIRPQHAMDFAQRAPAIFISHVVNGIERKKHEVEFAISEPAQIASVGTKNSRLWKFLLRDFRAFSDVIDARIVGADFKQVLRRTTGSNADVEHPLAFDLRANLL